MKKIILIILSFIIFLSFDGYSTPVLSSLPSAKATIFLDFDGQFVHGSSWNWGNSFYCTPSGLNDAEITEVFKRVSEDYRPFNINITTDSTAFLSAPLTQRMRVIVTLTSDWYLGVGGVSFTRSFTWGDDTPAFVFPDRLGSVPKYVAECCTHESGHTVGLSHQAKYNGSCTLVATYNNGVGTGQSGWAPVMGNSYYRNLSGWNNGPTPSGCTADQDNLSIITSINGFTYREDDHSDDAAVNPTELALSNNGFLTNGIITTNTDKDVFKFSLDNQSSMNLKATPFSVGPNNDGANLDVKVTLLNSDMQEIGVYENDNILDISIETILNKGTYYAIVQGSGNLNTSNYGSLGSYTLSANYVSMAVMPIHEVLLSGHTGRGKHELDWNIISDEPIKQIEIESSVDGTEFQSLATVSSSSTSFNYTPILSSAIFYRLKVTSIKGETVFSNIISLKAVENAGSHFKISTLVRSEISIQSDEKYRYQLSDMSGRMVTKGVGNAGVNYININHSPSGIYILQLISNSQRITQRIVRL